jgi:hypothetical protein
VLSLRHLTIFKQFDDLPDDSIVPDPVSAKVLSMSKWTLQRTNPVPPRRISERIRGRRVGDIRDFVRGKATS